MFPQKKISHEGRDVLRNKVQKALPYCLVGAVVLLLFGGLQAYSVMYQGWAAELLESATERPPEERGKIYQEVVKKYSRSGAGDLARMRLGFQALQEKRFDEAIDWYLPLIQKAHTPAIRISALEDLALAWRGKGDLAKCLEYLKRAADDRANATRDYTQFLLARVYEDMGEKDKAHNLYQQLSEGGGLVKEEAATRLKQWQTPETQPIKKPTKK